MRLQRFLAQAGVAARRKAEQLIVAGRVTVDGKVVTELGTKVDPLSSNVQVDGEGVAAQEHFYILFNKPKGCITTVSDDRGRLTVMDYLPNLPVSVAPVGRLDYYSEGVLLLTNDGDLAARLLGKAHHVAKTYHVKIRGALGPKDLDRLRTGVTLDDGTVTMEAEVDILHGASKHDWLVITLYEGKSRQIHRMLEALGHQVTKLQRVSFAGLTFHGLRVGDARELTQMELNGLRQLVGLDRSVTARGRWEAKREDTDRSRREFAARLAEKELAAAAAGGVVGGGGGERDEDEETSAFERQLEAAKERGRAQRGRTGQRSAETQSGQRDRGAGRGQQERGAGRGPRREPSGPRREPSGPRREPSGPRREPSGQGRGAGRREQAIGNRQPATGGRPSAGGGRPSAGGKRKAAGGGRRATGGGKAAAGKGQGPGRRGSFRR